jgi:hypothetical protein
MTCSAEQIARRRSALAGELELLDNWRFSRRMPSRAAAIRELLKRGLLADGFEVAGQGSMSKDFGVESSG